MKMWPKSALRPFAGCTIVAPSDLPKALVLASSLRQFHPDYEFFILLLERSGRTKREAEGARLVYPGDLELQPGDEWQLPMLHPAEELISILKPALLRVVLKSGVEAAAYFESTMEIFAPLDDIITLAATEDVIVTEQAGGSSSTERHPGRSFIAVRRNAQPFLEEWSRQLTNLDLGDASSNSEKATRTLAGPVDSYPHQPITDPAFNVGYWNLNPATFSWNGDRYEIEGKPLLSFNFRGYDPDKPHLLSKHQGLEPRLLLSEHPDVAKICDEYRDLLLRAGHDKSKSVPGSLRVLPSGLQIDARMLRLYREALSKFKQGLDQKPPSPFGPEGEEGFLSWLNQSVSASKKIVTRYMLAVYDEREDVKQAFPDPIGANATSFRDWYLQFGHQEMDLPAALVPQDSQQESASELIVEPGKVISPSVNVAGYFHAELGIGAAARALMAALETAGIPINTIPFTETASRQTHPFESRQSKAGPADINIVCINPDKFPAFAEKQGPELFHGRYTIGVWFWEVEDFPKLFHGTFNYVDEVWVASEFMRENFLKVSPKPVFKFQLPILIPPIDRSLSRADFGLPDQFVFLFSFDFFSVLERKNPLGLIEAFTRAFRPAEGPVLVIKTINGEKRILEMEKLRYAIRGRPDIFLRDGYLSAIENATLTAQADCYVSLHRSEGFGLTIAEAMALGKPCTATAYSGNLEFMTAENSYLCPCERSEVGPEREPYPATSHWSEPDVETAARLLRHVYTYQDEARIRGTRAAEDIRARHCPEFAGLMIKARLAKIRRRRGTSRPVYSVAFLEDRLEELECEMGLQSREGTRPRPLQKSGDHVTKSA
ncbi:MAG: hypothetical protein DLM73_01595 [Chthoniobacterales bacterium]|nr:MAG: hypothetical protein DLM73_01595 [Chthoniobacterales bacterium]